MIQDALSNAARHAVSAPPTNDLSWVAEAYALKRDAFKEKLQRQIERGHAYIRDKKRRGTAVRKDLRAEFAASDNAGAYIPSLSFMIDAIEDHAASSIKELARSLKQLKIVSKQVCDHDPSLKPFFGDLIAAVTDIARSEIDERLDFALFLRALRHEYSETAAPSVMFSSADDLDAFLETALRS